MADTTTSGETAAGAITGVELIRIVQSGNMRKAAAELIGHQFRGARAIRTTNQTTANYSSGAEIPFQSADVDTDAFWSAGSPNRLTIPAGLGITHVDVSASVRVELADTNTFTELAVRHQTSGATIINIFANYALTVNTTRRVNCAEVCIPVSDGDYFTAFLTQQTDTSITVATGSTSTTKLCLKVTGMEP